MLDAIMQDVRYAIRALRSSPGFAAVVILSLALGIGANTAIFSLIDSLTLKALPVSHPEQLLQVTMAKDAYFTNPIWEQLRDRQDVFFPGYMPTVWRVDALTWRPEARRATRRRTLRQVSFLTRLDCTP